MAQNKQVFLVDDHPLVREWLTNLINKRPDMRVCGEAATAPEALQLIGGLKPDIAIVDITLANGSGIELIKDIQLSHPKVAVLVLTMHDETVYALRALRAGARGYIMKCEATKQVIQAIRTILEGKLYVSDRVTALMAEKFAEHAPRKAGTPIELLSDRELEVFQLLGRGLARGRSRTSCISASRPSRRSPRASRKSSSWTTSTSCCAKPSAGRKASR